MSPPELSSVIPTDEQLSTRVNEPLEIDMPPPTRLSGLKPEPLANGVDVEGAKDANLKMYHVMSVKQTLREDLAEHAYQFSCRAAVWSRSDFRSVPMQFEPLELHVVDALGQQEVPDHFQQPAKAITEDVSVMRGPHALEWICDEFTASKTPSYPALRMAMSVASHMGWPIECWDVSTAFLYARLFGDRDRLGW